MQIAIIADDTKKELMTQFCIAYCGILSKHDLCATGTTGHMISDATGLKIERLLAGPSGGEEQIISRIEYDEIDILLFFRDSGRTPGNEFARSIDNQLLLLCDRKNIPLATNIATAEVLIMALERGDLNWRNYLNPRYGK